MTEDITFYDVRQIQRIFGVGRNMALRILDEVDSVRIGRKRMVSHAQLVAYLADHNGIEVSWPKTSKI